MSKKAIGYGAAGIGVALAIAVGTGLISEDTTSVKTPEQCMADLQAANRALPPSVAQTQTGSIMEITTNPQVKQNAADHAACMDRYTQSQSGFKFKLGW